ncbi:MAG: hypothetical protein B7733_04695 [Myxococcales bacterium FL481]|nr:MAG: hypothetical protein B7733_04695 [Myxococcales bacterium FL481]
MAKPLPSARQLAITVLREIERRRGFSNRVLSRHLERFPDLDPRDRGLVTHLVYGVLRHRARLDALVDRAAKRPAGVRGEVREWLRIGAFELRELDRPLHVVASQVQLGLKRIDRAGGLVGLATAILHQIDEHGAGWDDEAASGKPLDALERRWSVPRWLAGRWLATLGPGRALQRAQALLGVPQMDLRVDLSRITREHAEQRLVAEHPGCVVLAPDDQPQCLRVTGGGDLFYGPLHDDGLVSIQALGSQQAVLALELVPGERVLDACAGMGVKTAQIAESLRRQGVIVAVDSNAERIGELIASRSRVALDTPSLKVRAHVGDLLALGSEASAPAPAGGSEVADELVADLRGPFDAALLDAPCTGLGNLGRHPELRWTCRFADIGDRAALQQRLLAAVIQRVRPGGRVVYAVCSLEPEEGPHQVRRLVESHPSISVDYEATWTPEEHGADGFYAARLRMA